MWKKGILPYCWWECKLVQPLWRTVWRWCGLVTKLHWNVGIPCTIVHQDPLSMEFSRQKYQSGLPFPHPWDLPNPGIEPGSLAPPWIAGGFFTVWATREVSLHQEAQSNSSPCESRWVCDSFNQQQTTVMWSGFRGWFTKGHAVSVLFTGTFTPGALG